MTKAFQLKITIKNSKPPIWRRLIVPTGITFSQFSMILNEVMGWDGYHAFEFEFYHLELRIIEDAEEMEIGYGPYDYIEASKTYIREYLEENEWFTYTYDLGDDWQHRVTVEKVLEDYPYDYPQVIKYKGNCPVEDCGGIYAYYECLEVIQNENHPQYHEKLDWMREQGYPSEYDMTAVNAKLQEIYFYKWGKGEKRYQNEIYQDVFSGSKGLKASKKDKNKRVSVNQSGKHQLQDVMKKFQEYVQWNDCREDEETPCSIQNIFEDFDKEDILEIAQEKGLKGIEKSSKKELIRKLTDYMLTPEVMQSCFLCLEDEEIQEFEKAAQYPEAYEPEIPENLMRLYEAEYIGMFTDGRVTVPKEVAELYNSWDHTAFETERKKINYLLHCLHTASFLYGIFPMEVLQKLMKQNPKIHMTDEEIKAALQRMPSNFAPYIVVNGNVYHRDLYPDDRGLLSVQGNKEFYIPTFDEIMEYGVNGYNIKYKEMQDLKRFLAGSMNMGQKEAEYVCGLIQMNIMSGGQIQEIFDILEGLGLEISKRSQMEKLTGYIHKLWNQTRMLIHRGFTPNELSGKKPEKQQPVHDENRVINFEQARRGKIYPNAPCPCGSGKKYKNCCRNK
jgi:hypothetical protein